MTAPRLLPILLAACAAGAPTPDSEPRPDPRPAARGSDIAAVEGDYTGWDAAGLAMQGEWRSEDDPRAGLSVVMDPERGPMAAFTYDGENDGYMGMRFVAACQGFAPPEDVLLVTFGAGENQFCYAIVSLTPDRLVMSYVGRGNTLRYRREGGRAPAGGPS